MQSYQNELLGRGSNAQPIRHLIALIDGTGVSASQRVKAERYSNIYKLGLYIETHNDANESQLAFYLPGIGSKTSGLPLTNGAFAVQLSKEVEKVYINICTNYCYDVVRRVGDKIYIFGFSRGAVVARLVSALIGRYGLLKPSQIEMFDYIWSDFIGKAPIHDMESFRSVYCVEDRTSVEFLGLFDTVLGIHFGTQHSRLKRVFFGNRILGAHVKTVIHILARDESRNVFKPILFESKSNHEQVLEQIWMPGVHSDVGGGYSEDFLSKISLMTMLDRMRAYTLLKIDFERSLALRVAIEEALGQNRIVVNNELNGFWQVFRWFGQRVPVGGDQGQLIHPIYKSLEGRSFITKTKRTRLFHTPDFKMSNFAKVSSLENLLGKNL